VDYLRSGLPRDAYARARVNRSGRRYASVHVEAWQDNRRGSSRRPRAFPDADARRERGVSEAPRRPEPLTHARVLKIALPIVLSNATVPLLGIVDTGVVGQLGEAGAHRRGGHRRDHPVLGLLDLRLSAHGHGRPAAPGAGRGRRGEVAALLTRVADDRVGAGLALILLQVPIFWGAFVAVAGERRGGGAGARLHHDPHLVRARAIAIYGITGWLIAQERTGAVLALQLCA
jgi:MATE family multidrug resistance protein